MGKSTITINVNLRLIRDGPGGNDGGQRSSDIYGQSVRMEGEFYMWADETTKQWLTWLKKTCKKPNDDDNEVHFDVIYLQE
jgi:hypothetical protein